MAGKLSNYQFGLGGVNLSKEPLHLGDDEATQLQNAELIPDVNRGGQGSLSKRGGLATFTTAMAGSVLGIIGLPLKTTFTRTLYASLGTFDSDKWAKTTNGTSWTSITTPSLATNTPSSTNYTTIGTNAFPADRRMVGYKTFIIYPGADYTSDLVTPANNTALDMDMWDGTTAIGLFRLQVGGGSSDGNFSFTVTDMLKANNTIYFAVHSPINGGTPKGSVYSMDITTGVIQQVATPFSATAGHMSGGAPTCLAWYQGKLWVGVHKGDGVASQGKVVWCYPGIDTAWTSDTATLDGYPHSLCVFRGNLFAGLHGNATFDAATFVRTSTTGAWTSSDTVVTSGLDYYGSLIVYSSELYAVVYSDGGADVQLIRKFDGTSWTTDRDVAASDGAGTAYQVGNSILYGSDLFICFISSAGANADGFILRKTAGTWSKVATDNFTGRMGVLLERT